MPLGLCLKKVFAAWALKMRCCGEMGIKLCSVCSRDRIMGGLLKPIRRNAKRNVGSLRVVIISRWIKMSVVSYLMLFLSHIRNLQIVRKHFVDMFTRADDYCSGGFFYWQNITLNCPIFCFRRPANSCKKMFLLLIDSTVLYRRVQWIFYKVKHIEKTWFIQARQ